MSETFIREYDIPEELCDKLTEFFYRNKHAWRQGQVTVRGEGQVDKNKKDSTDLSVPLHQFGLFDPLFPQMMVHVDNYLKELIVDAGSGYGPYGVVEEPNIQLYPVGGGYTALHHERQGGSWPMSHRMLTWMIYLNDVPDGGTYFPYQDVTTEAKKGKLVVWPSDFTHIHRGVVSETTEKLIFTGWCSYVTPMQHDINPQNQLGNKIDDSMVSGWAETSTAPWDSGSVVTPEEIAELEKSLDDNVGC